MTSSSPNTVRVAAIGCGAIAERLHVPDYHVAPEAEIVAFCDTDRARAEALAAQYAPVASIFEDYQALLDANVAEAVSVCLPNALHAPVTIAALEAGRHVLVEKPMAATMDEAHAMLAAAKAAGKLLMVNQTMRRVSVFRKAKEVMQSGILGPVRHVSATFGHNGPDHWSPPSKWFFQREHAILGAMGDLGVHMADTIRYLTEAEVTSISAFTATTTKTHSEVEDNFVSCFTLDNGAVGTLAASWTVEAGPGMEAILHCANGSLHANRDLEPKLIAYLKNPASTIHFDLPAPLNDYEGTWGADVGGGFVRAILAEEPPFCTAGEGLRSLEVVLAAGEAAATGKTVLLEAEGSAP